MTTNQPYSASISTDRPYPLARKRPLGVTVLAILEILGGLVQLILALGFLAIAALLNISDIQQRIC
jgi:hypothetical protein